MAAANKTREGTYNQKRSISVLYAGSLAEADILTDGQIVAVLPERIIIDEVIVNVTTVSTTATATVDVLIGTDVIANEVAVTVAGAIVGTRIPGKMYQASGGAITIKAGAVTPADDDLVCDLIIKYIELDKKTGEYTSFYSA